MNQAHDFLPETETSVPIIRAPGDGKAVSVLRDQSTFKVLTLRLVSPIAAWFWVIVLSAGTNSDGASATPFTVMLAVVVVVLLVPPPTDASSVVDAWKVSVSMGVKRQPAGCKRISENSKANRIETMNGPAESGQICSVGRRKIAKKIAKNKRCMPTPCDPAQGMLLKVMRGG
jgi:hypothetical protein